MGSYCCLMRQKFLIGIVKEDTTVKSPADVLDFMDFDNVAADGRPILRIKWCPFCGVAVKGPLRVDGDA